MADERDRAARAEKMLGDFQEQAGKPFEHEARLKELLGRQAELNAALDLDKGERQVAPPAEINPESGSDDGMEPAGRASGTDVPRPRRAARRRRECDTPDVEEADVDADDEAVVRKKPGPTMGPKGL